LCLANAGRRLTVIDIYKVLKELGIEFEKHEHPPVYTVEEADLHRGKLQGGQTKNLFLRNKKGKRHYLLVASAHRKVDLKGLRGLFGEAAMSFASRERLKRYLGVEPGSVSPFGLINDTNHEVVVVMDRDLLRHQRLAFHPNVNTATLIVGKDDFLRFLEHCGNEIRIVDLTSAAAADPPAQQASDEVSP
jgi:Ala-tRNA(Pro) deacylase